MTFFLYQGSAYPLYGPDCCGVRAREIRRVRIISPEELENGVKYCWEGNCAAQPWECSYKRFYAFPFWKLQEGVGVAEEGIIVFKFAGRVFPAAGRPKECPLFPESFGSDKEFFVWSPGSNGFKPCWDKGDCPAACRYKEKK